MKMRAPELSSLEAQASDLRPPTSEMPAARKRPRQWWIDPWHNAPPDDFVVAVDTREQQPWFADPMGQLYPWARRATLAEGDYSLVGHEDEVVVERKSLADLYASLGATWKERSAEVKEARKAGASREQLEALTGREERKWQRLGAHGRSLFVVEANYSGVIDPTSVVPADQWRSQLSPTSCEGTLIAWSLRYGVELFFAGNRTLAQRFVVRWLAAWWRDRQTEGRA